VEVSVSWIVQWAITRLAAAGSRGRRAWSDSRAAQATIRGHSAFAIHVLGFVDQLVVTVDEVLRVQDPDLIPKAQPGLFQRCDHLHIPVPRCMIGNGAANDSAQSLEVTDANPIVLMNGRPAARARAYPQRLR